LKALLIVLIASLLPGPALPQDPTFSLTTNVVVVNVTVLDREAKPVETLTKDEFSVYEDGKLQKLQAVDLQRLSGQVLPPLNPDAPPVEPAAKGFNPEREKSALSSSMRSNYQDRRLIVMLFDFGSMQPAEQVRAKQAAIKFLSRQLTASDTVSIMTYGSELKTVLDFTSDRDLLVNTINKFRVGEASENATFADQSADSQDQSGTFVADETEFNIFNADQKLAALEDAASKLGQYPEKKALIYFSSGIQKNGVDNQSQLRATANTAVRANVAFYPIDARGLSALVPGADATQAGAAGNNLYSGAGQRSLRENFHNQQETLATLASDTGGKALLDSNDLTEGMRQVQADFSSYYVLSYVSSNTAQDGRYRRIQVKLAPRVAQMKLKLDYRQGYYAPTIFARRSSSDKEAQLSQALTSENPITDLPLSVEIDHFRVARDKYFAPISVKIPGSALAFHNKGAKQATELDFIAEVFDARNRPASTVRDTIPLKVDGSLAGQVVRKSLQYDTGVTLTPGKYRLRFVARENGEGKTGTFESTFTIPDLASGTALHVSSLILSNQREPVAQQVAGVKNDKKLLAQNPLIENGQKLLPNVTRVFRPGQTMLVYLEVYDPVIPENLPENFRRPNVQANVAFYRDNRKVFETAAVRMNRVDEKRQNTVPVWISVPVDKIEPGRYECQVNVIDQFGRKFAFPRTNLAVLPAQALRSEKPRPSATVSSQPS
jgi:VWFA-related protein